MNARSARDEPPLAEDDEIVPERSTLALFEGLPHPDRKRLLRVQIVGHNEWFWQVTDVQWREMLAVTEEAAKR